jgi:hypothetical protein
VTQAPTFRLCDISPKVQVGSTVGGSGPASSRQCDTRVSKIVKCERPTTELQVLTPMACKAAGQAACKASLERESCTDYRLWRANALKNASPATARIVARRNRSLPTACQHDSVSKSPQLATGLASKQLSRRKQSAEKHKLGHCLSCITVQHAVGIRVSQVHLQRNTVY